VRISAGEGLEEEEEEADLEEAGIHFERGDVSLWRERERVMVVVVGEGTRVELVRVLAGADQEAGRVRAPEVKHALALEVETHEHQGTAHQGRRQPGALRGGLATHAASQNARASAVIRCAPVPL